jgi:hypothetical protein
MKSIKHKIFGEGTIVAQEVKEIGSYITVRFESGRESRFAIPESFETGMIIADEILRVEVEAAVAEKKARDRARLGQIMAVSTAGITATPSHRHGRMPKTPVTVKGSIEIAFEEYLVNAGYCEYTDAGNPSTVFSYINAIKKVLEEEGMSWHSLQSDIVNIIPIYDIGGTKQHIGSKSNYTVINALKRFSEFVNP